MSHDELPPTTLCIALFNPDGSVADVIESWELALADMELDVCITGAYATVLSIPEQRH